MGWGNGFMEWVDGGNAYLSVVFSWNLQTAYQRAVWYKMEGYNVCAGGPAVMLNPERISQVAKIGDDYYDAIRKHNPNATFTSRGCIRNCKFCAVPKMEDKMIELNDWSVRPIVCDNNLLACSRNHFDSVIDKLRPLRKVDFNQGLDARLLTAYHADRLRELNLSVVRIAWDNTGLENEFMSAHETLRRSGFHARKIRVYVLIGFNDTPDDALYRLETIKSLGSYPNVMRYQPVNSKIRNNYVSPEWSDRLLKHFARYWNRLGWWWKVPFSEYESAGFKYVQ